MDVMASEEARAVVMKRNREGPLDVWCWDIPSKSALEKFITDVKTIWPTRVWSVLYEFRRQSRSFMNHLQAIMPNNRSLYYKQRDGPASSLTGTVAGRAPPPTS
ncbi:hypothetical protein M407DRAFT_22758 [Tulasnella calospora MUT 4182]|uniref:Uncharacterized protein n=1 Tax=Tulasnella calospora MUT 4182 TaxID=1051891 RepID=A0A0C3QBR2_9AGAM|nr:hypothetical protein M407DRAFT_22758 [Tulasnella calospora MUT 4182]